MLGFPNTRGPLKRGAAVVFCASVGLASAADPPPITSPDLLELQKQLLIEQQRNSLQTELLKNQKELIDAQKASVESQGQLLVSQKAMLDAMFPQVNGGKSGAITFDATTNIGPLAQENAIRAANDLSNEICRKLSKYENVKSVVIGDDSDLKLVAQARWVGLQLDGIKEAYKEVNLPASASASINPNTFPGGGGMALYGISAALKEVASFTQLFRTDSAIYGATITLNQSMLTESVAGCMRSGKIDQIYLPRSLLVKSLSNPTESGIQENLKSLAELRGKSDTVLNQLMSKSDDASKTRVARLTALNTRMDQIITTLFSVTEKAPEPLFVGVLAGEAIQQKMGAGTHFMRLSLSNAAAAGLKRTSLWRSDRLYSWTTVSIAYSLFDATGNITASGLVNNVASPEKVIVAP